MRREKLKKFFMGKIEIISRAVIIKEGSILVCRDKANKNYFLPGGHMEFGEFSADTLSRELKEELSLRTSDAELIGIAENKYFARGKCHQEINLVYKVDYKDLRIESKEDHIEFTLFSKKEFQKNDIRPRDLKEAVLSWQNNRKFFHIITVD